MYERTDASLKTLQAKIRKEFAKSRRLMAFDELNVIKACKELYSKLDDTNRREFLKLARARYKDITGEEDEKKISMKWLLVLLLGYNPVTEYVYENEVTRKRERFTESVIAGANKLAMINRAMTLWLRQTEQYLILVEDAAVLEAYKAIGVKRVRWVTQHDKKRCADCAERSGKIYDINHIPPKPHLNCRCYLVPEE